MANWGKIPNKVSIGNLNRDKLGHWYVMLFPQVWIILAVCAHSNVTLLPSVTNCHPNHHLSVHVRLSNLDSGRPGGAVHSLKLELRFPEEVDQDVDADVDRGADQEKQQPHVDELGR